MIDINALLVKHGGLPPPHHVEVDAPDGVYRGVRVTGKRAVARTGGDLRRLAHSLPGKVRVLGPVEEAPAPQPVPDLDRLIGAVEEAPAPPAPAPKRQRNRPLSVVADPKPAASPAVTTPDDDW